ncbi:E3 ubiquitin-protein ligase COP1 [Nosema granulosis]|uniref:E3 ubiquitin-protein ligase COP1 n=1 Tax=Nosema granulosis TaxID=83296 RepID=A0A9P6GXJ5_9MICR|nr:E3 ubiquitin-protein ligase COP1 [Nosema granulosis]
MENICKICREELNIAHWLPCNHKFCYICIRRHLENRNFCATCFRYPLSISDLKTNEKIVSDIKKPISLFKVTLPILKRELKKFRINTDGTIERLRWRYNELCIQIDNERFKENPRSIDTIARQLHLRESRIFSQNRNLEMSKIHTALCKLKYEMNSKLKDTGEQNNIEPTKDKPLEENVNNEPKMSKKGPINLLNFFTRKMP